MTGTRSHLVGTAPTAREAVKRWQAAPISSLVMRESDVVIDLTEHEQRVVAEHSEFAPIRGVSLELFADVAQAVAARDDDRAHGTSLAAKWGISPEDWSAASKVWNQRIANSPEVAGQLMELFRVTGEKQWLAS